MNETARQIEKCERILQALREEFDRLDANHPGQSMQVAKDISDCAKELENLIAKQKGISHEKQ